MITLTAEQFRKKYGVMGETKFDAPKQEQGLFSAIKEDFAKRGREYVDIINEPEDSLLDETSKGVRGVATLAGGIGNIVGESLTRIPYVGGAVKAIGGVIKSGLDTVAEKLGGTKFMQEAAEGLGEDSTIEKGLEIVKGGGEIAENILIAEGAGKVAAKTATYGAKKAVQAGKATGEAVSKMTGGAGKYLKGAIRDIAPT